MIAGTIQTWNRDLYGLFDYNQQNLKKQIFKLTQVGQIIRDHHSNLQYKKSNVNTNESISLKSDTIIQKPLYVSFEKLQMLGGQLIKNEKAYLVVKSLRNLGDAPRGYRLKQGDRFKLGRVEFSVKEIVLADDDIQIKNYKQCINKDDRIIIHDQDIQQQQQQFGECRICYDKQICQFNPLLEACQCRGRYVKLIRQIHLDCLRKCIQMKVDKHSSHKLISYKLKQIKCELCGSDLYTKLMIMGQFVDLFSFDKPKGSYIVIQGFGVLHYITLVLQEKLNIGRSGDSDIQIKEETISRQHASIQYFENGDYRLFDHQSKFGTLIEIQDYLKITHQSIQCQVGRTLIDLSQTDI